MIRSTNFGLLAGILLISTSAFAQSRFSPVRLNSMPAPQLHSAMPARAVTSSRPMIIRLPAAPAVHRGSDSNVQTASSRDAVFSTTPRSTAFSTGTFLDLGQFLGNGVPGLGFDFAHLAALNGNLGVRAIIDPVTQHELALTEQLLRDEQGVPVSTFIPFSGYSEPVAYEQPAPQQPPQIIVLQQPVASQEQPAAEAPAPSTAQTAEQPPLPPVGEFVLVLHSGKQIKAVAFTRQSDSIVYITAGGTRGSFPAADLDASATEQLNQQHGTPLKLSL